MAVPEMSDEQRAENLGRAVRARKIRAEVRGRLGSGDMSVAEVLKAVEAGGETGEILGRMKVMDLLQSLPYIGEARAARTLERLEIAASRRLRGLGAHQRDRLCQEFA